MGEKGNCRSTYRLCVCAQLCPTLCHPMNRQASLSMGSSDKNTGVGSHSLLQGIFLTQGWNLGLLHWRQVSEPPGKPFSSVPFSRSVVSDSLRCHESQHARPPCPSPTPGVYLNPCPLSWWCHPAISSSVVPFSSCPQSLPASGSFPVSQLFAWGGQSIGVSASISVLPVKHPGLVGSPCSPRDSQESSPTPQFKSINFSALSFLHRPTLTSIHDHWRNHSLD